MSSRRADHYHELLSTTMNCFLTVNVNDVLTGNARGSFADACRRWGSDFHEIRVTRNEKLHPSFNKFLAATEMTRYDRICVFDADMLIRSDAPSPFDVFPETACFYAAPDLPPHLPEVHDEVRRCIHFPYHQVLEDAFAMKVNVEHFLQNPINTGFFVCSPVLMGEMLQLLLSHFPDRCEDKQYEQAMVNYLLAGHFSERLRIVSSQWNYLNPPAPESSRMLAWVYHFTGRGYDHRNRILTSQWKVKP